MPKKGIIEVIDKLFYSQGSARTKSQVAVFISTFGTARLVCPGGKLLIAAVSLKIAYLTNMLVYRSTIYNW